MVNVRELIEKLKEQDQDARVWVGLISDKGEFHSVADDVARFSIDNSSVAITGKSNLMNRNL